MSVCSILASPLPGVNGTLIPEACSIAKFPASTIVSAILTPCVSAMVPRVLRIIASSLGLFPFHLFCGSSRIRAPLAPPRISELR